MKFILGISGASGTRLGIRFLKVLPRNFDIHVVLSYGAIQCMKSELQITDPTTYIINTYPDVKIYNDSDMQAPIASGSFQANAMAIIPTSMDCVAKIACGISDTLLTRAASVIIKEQKKLLLSPREMPLSSIICKHLYTLAKIGVIIAPPILGYYSNPKNLDDMENFIFGKWLDSLAIQNTLYTRWGSHEK